jgi:hypothetical protein
MTTVDNSESSQFDELLEKDLFGKIAWEAREYERKPKSATWFAIAGIVLAGMIIYAIITQSPIMAITFILIGVVGYLFINREYPIISVVIDVDGIHVGKEMYPYENIRSFWIFYEPGEEKALSLHTNGDLTPFVRVPLGDKMSPLHLRTLLLQFLPERRHPQQLIDILEKYF